MVKIAFFPCMTFRFAIHEEVVDADYIEVKKCKLKESYKS